MFCFVCLFFSVYLIVFEKNYVWVNFRPAVRGLAFGKDFCLLCRGACPGNTLTQGQGLRAPGGTQGVHWKCNAGQSRLLLYCHCEDVMVMVWTPVRPSTPGGLWTLFTSLLRVQVANLSIWFSGTSKFPEVKSSFCTVISLWFLFPLSFGIIKSYSVFLSSI